MTTSRLLIVSNRLPVTVVAGPGGAVFEPSTGGLATGLRGPHDQGEGLWFGWPGPMRGLAKPARAAAEVGLRNRRFVPIRLSRDEVERYYNDFSNGVLWPTFHYLIDRLPLQTPDWEVYRQVNERFAEAVIAEYRPGDRIWVHDFHLMLLPALLRERLPEARIGFFLHVPFPSSEVFRVLPWRDDLLRGLLGADLIGFHTLSYLRHFAAAALRMLGLETEIDRLQVGSREVRLAAMPMGIDTATFDQLGRDPAVIAEAQTWREAAGGARIVLGIDRLDYTKGILRRLLTFHRLLARRDPAAPRVQLVQVAVTSRAEVSEYQTFKRSVDEQVGRINGEFGTPEFTPIRYMNRALDARAVAALYRAADVMLVTPLRDGLNLVAKEFVATRVDDDGVLVLSEFAGAAAEMVEALQFNPYDIDRAAGVIEQALAMPPAERRRRLAPMRDYLARTDVHAWVAAFLRELDRAPPPQVGPRRGVATVVAAVQAARQQVQRTCVFLDYDGTLVGFAARPEFAAPDPELLALLARLAACPGLEVHVVSGRPREFLDRWFGDLPLSLHAEHGLVSRPARGTAWTPVPGVEPDWRPRVIALLERVAAHIPGSFVEDKSRSIAWHYRQVEPAFASSVAKELRLHLLELLGNLAVAVVEGNRVIEVRPQGVHKGQVVARALQEAGMPVGVLVIGDDRTDEDMFLAVPADAVTVKVGAGTSVARFVLDDAAAVRSALQAIVA
ncbi:MAG: bifunctional alpha,alpha-trehalose-phosphate synthase (UDP-forming)/trehalose-phosphatase [Planctomycetes bacterium]|nr:bifunctional alpha,alpha-trehalose-phosphate synthase (UDP-forming)/trehalose-phosphatase [Planctomycetota bacterium]